MSGEALLSGSEEGGTVDHSGETNLLGIDDSGERCLVDRGESSGDSTGVPYEEETCNTSTGSPKEGAMPNEAEGPGVGAMPNVAVGPKEGEGPKAMAGSKGEEVAKEVELKLKQLGRGSNWDSRSGSEPKDGASSESEAREMSTSAGAVESMR